MHFALLRKLLLSLALSCACAVAPAYAQYALKLSGGFSHLISGSTVTITVGEIKNIGSGPSPHMWLELWADVDSSNFTSDAPGHYRLAQGPSLDPLFPGEHFTNVAQTLTYTAPAESGSYYVVLKLKAFCPPVVIPCTEDTLSTSSRIAFSNSATAANYSDMWWNPSESGWGLALLDHDTQIFGVWYTYDANGRPKWFTLPGGTLSADKRTFTADLYATTGPSYTAPSFNPNQVGVTKVGNASFDFNPPALQTGTALFTYTLGGVTQTKQIQRQSFGTAAPAWDTDNTDLWWNANESGWGASIVQHGNNIFGVFYLYDTDGQPLWVVMPGGTFSGASFTGSLFTTHGPAFSAVPFNPSLVTSAPAGTATFTFAPTTLKSAVGHPDLACNSSFDLNLHGTRWNKCIDPQSFGRPSTRGRRVTITPLAMNPFTVGSFGSQRVARGNNGSPPYHFVSDTFANGAPPFGMTISTDLDTNFGLLSGTPSVAGVYTFGVCAVDLGGNQSCQQNQATVQCTIAISPASASVPASGGSGVISVTPRTGCDWTASSNDSWIAITASVSNGTVNYSAAANTGSQRNGSVRVGTQTFSLAQAAGQPPGGNCSYRICTAGTASSGGLFPVPGTPCGCTIDSTDTVCTPSAPRAELGQTCLAPGTLHGCPPGTICGANTNGTSGVCMTQANFSATMCPP